MGVFVGICLIMGFMCIPFAILNDVVARKMKKRGLRVWMFLLYLVATVVAVLLFLLNRS